MAFEQYTLAGIANLWVGSGIDDGHPHVWQLNGRCVECRVDRDLWERYVELRREDPLPADWREWWRQQAETEIELIGPKVDTYGSDDLVEVGRAMTSRKLSDGEYAELGVAFYVTGKMARIMAAIREGRDPGDDSWFDLAVYAKMAQRIRQSGGWPG